MQPPTMTRSMGRFVEELLRLEPPVRALSRVTTEPVTLGDTPLPKGAHLLILFASANDDEDGLRLSAPVQCGP